MLPKRQGMYFFVLFKSSSNFIACRGCNNISIMRKIEKRGRIAPIASNALEVFGALFEKLQPKLSNLMFMGWTDAILISP